MRIIRDKLNKKEILDLDSGKNKHVFILISMVVALVIALQRVGLYQILVRASRLIISGFFCLLCRNKDVLTILNK